MSSDTCGSLVAVTPAENHRAHAGALAPAPTSVQAASSLPVAATVLSRRPHFGVSAVVWAVMPPAAQPLMRPTAVFAAWTTLKMRPTRRSTRLLELAAGLLRHNPT